VSAEIAAAQPKLAHLWERDEHDWYVEESRATRALLTVERFVGTVLDPACGRGNIVEALIAAGYRAHGSDIVRRTGEPWFLGRRDFLEDGAVSITDNIATNPPFFRAKGTEAFIRRALALAKGKVAVFTDIKFLAGDGRATGLYAEHPPTRVWSLSPRISCPPGSYLEAGNKAGGGTADWVWLVWDCTAPSTRTEFGWLRAPKEAGIDR
jgi:hypothetical protein